LLAVVDLGRHAAGRLAGRTAVGLGSGTRRQALAIGREVGALRLDDFTRLGGTELAQLVGRRDVENGTGLQPVHVLAGKRLRVAAIERHQHLVQ